MTVLPQTTITQTGRFARPGQHALIVFAVSLRVPETSRVRLRDGLR